MASMNNWLAFSLSPQELPSQQPVDHHQDHQSSTVPRLGFNSDEISRTDVSGGECFDLTSAPSLNLPPPFGILEAFNRNNNQSQDWNMKGLGTMNSDGNYKSSSELSMFMGSSCNTQNHEPKLENFLGNNSFSGHQQNNFHGGTLYNTTTGEYMFSSQDTTTNARTSIGEVENNNSNINAGNSSGSSIGLSMIKTWLRNQPAPAQAAEVKNNGGGSQSLSLSMSTGSQTGSPLPLLTTTSNGGGGGSCGGESSSSDNNNNNNNNNKQHQKTPTCMDITQSGASTEATPRKSIDTFGQRTSIYRGVTRHRWTGRYEAHLWDNSCRREGQTRKGRQVYLGGYDKEEKAARAYDLAALKYWGTTTTTNFPISNYEKEVEEMKHMTRQEYVASLRRKSSGFSRGASIYRGVTRHHQHGRWQARIGRVAGNKDLYLGTFSTQEEAAEAYDIAAIKFRGLNAVTNFDMSRYDVKSILESSTLPIGGNAKRLKEVEQAEMALDLHRTDNGDNLMSATAHLSDGINNYGAAAIPHHAWPAIAFQQAQAQPFSMHYPYGGQRAVWCKQELDSDTNHAFQDLHQLQLGSTHNFFQPSVLHNLMAMDSVSSMENSSGSNSNSVIYSSTGDDGNYQGVGGYGGSGGYANAIPLGTVVASGSDSNQNQSNGGYSENMYYISQQSPTTNGVKGSAYDHQAACNNWVPTAIPTFAQRSGNMVACHGTPAFTWNDT